MGRIKKGQRKHKERLFTSVRLPEETVGVCVNKHCCNHRAASETILGNGHCVRCWDRRNYYVEDNE